MTLIDGKKVSAEILEQVKQETASFMANGGKQPHLAAVLVGNDGGSETYVASKMKTCEKVGFKSSLIRHAADITEDQLMTTVKMLNEDPDIDGFIVQLPLPKHINEQKIIEAVNPQKDVDGFHPVNVGKMVLDLPCFVSATPNGIMQLLKAYKIETSGKHCVVIGRSNIVGTPMSVLLSRNNEGANCTVTLCHSRTKDLASHTLRADIIVCALGKPEFLKGNMVKEGAVVIDVGTTRVPSTETKSGFKLKGDVAFEEVAPKCSYITPVPGGVGPMTIASLISNTLKAVKSFANVSR